MKNKYPRTIENCIGEKLVFVDLLKEEDGDRLLVENFVQPGIGPLMHTHWLQDECLTVIKGRIGYEIPGQPEQFASEGETVFFQRGVAHRFWNAGNDILHCKGYIKPVNSFEFFLSSIFDAQNKSGSSQPEKFDAAFLMTRYSSEFDLSGIPSFVKRAVIPFTYQLGRLLGKYKHFENAPKPVTL